MSSKLDICLESFNKSVLEVTRGTYGGKWPMPFFTSLDVGSLIGDYWGDFFVNIIEAFRNRKMNTLDIAKKLAYPSPFSRAFYPNVELKYNHYPIDKLRTKDLFVSELMYPLYKQDPFCANLTNILWDKEQIGEKFRREKVIWLEDLEGIKEALQYNGYLRAITEMLFFYFDNIGHEFHGPYELDAKEILLVREWHDWKPGYFEFCEHFPYDSVTTYEIYKPGTEIKIDISNRLYIASRIDECLLGFYFEIMGNAVLLRETLSLLKEIKEFCRKGVGEITSIEPKEMLEKAVHMHFYLLKPLTDVLGTSWKPSEGCMKRVEKGIRPEDKKAFKSLMRLQLDAATVEQLFDYRQRPPVAFYE